MRPRHDPVRPTHHRAFLTRTRVPMTRTHAVTGGFRSVSRMHSFPQCRPGVNGAMASLHEVSRGDTLADQAAVVHLHHVLAQGCARRVAETVLDDLSRA